MEHENTYQNYENKLIRQQLLLSTNQVLMQVIDAMNIYVVLLNSDLEIIVVNKEVRDSLFIEEAEILGKRTGDLFQCKYVQDGICGELKTCEQCGARNISLEVTSSSERSRKEVSFISSYLGMDVTTSFEQSVSMIRIEDDVFYLAAYAPSTSDKEKINLDHVFYHDILNTASGVYNAIRLLKMENKKFEKDEDINEVEEYIENIIEEIQYHRNVVHAEEGDLFIAKQKINVSELIRSVIARMKKDQRYQGILVFLKLEEPRCMIETDHILLRRIITNLLKNAFEANRGGEIWITTSCNEEYLEVRVHNDEVIPEERQSTMFRKGSSGKGKGRGYGTYGSKLLLNKYLNGDLTYHSKAGTGTDFYLKLFYEKEN